MKYWPTTSFGIVAVLFVCLPAAGQDPGYPKELNLVLEYIKRSDYPEVFDQQYQVRVRGLAIEDIDGDGTTEVFLQTFPHYRQSPTITIYQVDKLDSVKRLTEGLAPGKLVPLDAKDDYLDSHVLGKGIDLVLGDGDISKMVLFAKSSLTSKMSAVVYKTFVHTDTREGKPVYIDLSYLDCKENTCENFQFQKPAYIVTGTLPGNKDKSLLVRVGDEIYKYAIKAITADGFLERTVWVEKVPTDFSEFVVEEGMIRYRTIDGRTKHLPF